jgi:hypothetical protein
MRVSSLALLIALLAGCAGGSAMMEDPYADIVGTWAGPAYSVDDDTPVSVTMVLEENEGVLSGTVSAPAQMMDNVRLRNLTYEDGTLDCSVPMDDGMGGVITIFVSLTMQDDGTLRGSFVSDVVEGVMTLTKR